MGLTLKELELRGKLDEKDKQIAELKTDLRDAGARLAFVKDMQARAKAVRGAAIRRKERISGLREGTAVALASDWHVGEHIEPEKVLYANGYDMDVARLRAERFFHGIAWLVNNISGAFAPRDLILWLGGDIITGYIHEEILENSLCSPLEAVRYSRSLILSGINMLLDELPKVENLYVLCSPGNHGRSTQKKRISTAAENSFEYLMYLMLLEDYADNDRVTFVVSRASQIHFQVYDWWSRWLHGDEVCYNKGIGGPMVPINRAVLRWNEQRKCRWTCMGHHHTYQSGESVVINGSLCGYSPYALKNSYAVEPPAQAFFMIDSKRGKCLSTPIWVDSDKEPWKSEQVTK